MEAFAYGDAAKEIMDLIHAANHYIEDSEPWTLAKDPAKAGELANVIWNLLEAIRISAHLLMPLMPSTSAEALRRIGCEGEAATDDMDASCVPASWPLVYRSRRARPSSPVWVNGPDRPPEAPDLAT